MQVVLVLFAHVFWDGSLKQNTTNNVISFGAQSIKTFYFLMQFIFRKKTSLSHKADNCHQKVKEPLRDPFTNFLYASTQHAVRLFLHRSTEGW